ncbi:hypothetical protein J2S43_001689 [Catenuloplanes nepalensis]|uniref:Uncharacterized protein n=1 Tax=Catenuloplanes nepalensis TaxID=587533 RepID=A0ABT9MP09_9ACTN|nr:hypothetical protein [Catenuloplanes nepalensis]MDP9793177.1 hypothetical protein [Catenuloplanes nepalensis]
MPTRRLYAHVHSSGNRYPLLTLHADGSLTADDDEMADAIAGLRDTHGLSNEAIFHYMKNKANAYVKHVEEIEDE